MGQKLSNAVVNRALRVTAILSIALAAGQFVQTIAAKPAPVEEAAAKLPAKIVPLSAAPVDADFALRPARADWVVQARPDALVTLTDEVVEDCTPHLRLKPLPGAVLGVVFSAPCDAGARVVLSHAGLTVTHRIPTSGELDAHLPAMASDGRVEIRLPDGREVVATLPVALEGTRRFAVQWLGAQGFVLHGLEHDAGFDEAGDISPNQPGLMAQGGWLSVIGDAGVDNPLLAHVYTYPQDGMAEVVVEAPVTAATCGHDLLGQTVESRNGTAAVTDLTLAMPDCSAIGDFLVLKNLAQDVKLAAR